MEAYTGFARVYDRFMDNVPYDQWGERICRILAQEGITDGILVDLGCGTGVMTRLLAARGYDMIGVDLSEDMLAQARQQEDEGILYLQQDMCELELFGTARGVVCLCDSLNYLLEEEELAQTFLQVKAAVDPGGLFIFDVNTPYKYREILGETMICENREDICFNWENYFDEESAINEYIINVFERTDSGLYARYEEIHYQRAYETEFLADLLAQTGWELLAVYGEEGFLPPKAETERALFVCRAPR